MPYSDLPEPKFRVGQTVWYADATKTKQRFDCPDCGGAQTWRVTTPAGGDYEVPCQRCSGGYTYTYHDEIAPLAYLVAVAAPKSLTIKALEVRNWSGEGPTIWYDGRAEGGLFATQEAAQSVAEAEAANWNAKQARTPEMLAAKNVGKLKIGGAYYDQFANGLWNAWYAYRSAVDRLAEWVDEAKEAGEAEYVTALRDSIVWEIEYREKQDRPLDVLVDAVRAALAGDLSALQPAYDKLPEPLRREQPEAEAA